jgi:hypothetical protein
MIKQFGDHTANERTYLAWIRTAITIIGFGMKGPWHVPGELNLKVHFITFFLAAITRKIFLKPMMIDICF